MKQNNKLDVYLLMHLYHLTRRQHLPISAEEAWAFFSSPRNLEKITPEKMSFHIRYRSGGDHTYPGQIIEYHLKLFWWLPLHWVSEITHVKAPHYFVDEQRFGPYAFWHHQHHFITTDDGVEMIDYLTYAIPFGIFGRLAHWAFVGREVNAIFDYRNDALQRLFPRRRLNIV